MGTWKSVLRIDKPSTDRLPRIRTAHGTTRLGTPAERSARIVFVVNVDWFFMSHRLPLAQAVLRAGAEVYVIGSDTGYSGDLEAEGVRFIAVPIVRSKVNVLAEVRTLFRLGRIYRELRPDIVHHITIKPILYGSLAARATPRAAIVNAVSGRGSVFGDSHRHRTVRIAVDLLYKFAVANRASRTIFQNVEDRDYFLSKRWIRENDAVLIRGSGVDMQEFRPTPEPCGTPIVLFASRLLREKGVEDFVAVARRFSTAGVGCRFVLVGRIDSGSPTAVARSEVDAWVQEGIIEWWGNRNDMSAVYSQATLVVLPTFYKEGVPKALIEAAACGRPIVTTDVPGCRDIVRDGQNGFLIPPRDRDALAHAIRTLLDSPLLRQRFGEEGRRLAAREFDVSIVTAQTLAIYRSLLVGRASPNGVRS